LSGVELDYLFLDASHFKMHDGQRAEPILAAWGITTAGKPVFVGLAAAGTESTDAWHDFLTDLIGRGLKPPLLILSDGAPGLISAAEQAFARSLRQRCLVHRSCKESTWRFVWVGFHESEDIVGGAEAASAGCYAVAVLVEQGLDVVNGVADGAAADAEQVGQGLLIA